MSWESPISILEFSKVLEKVYSRLINFLNIHASLSISQFRFRKKRSTKLALVAPKRTILKIFEDEKIFIGGFIDFSKAFDSPEHDILLRKRKSYGIRKIAYGGVYSFMEIKLPRKIRKPCVTPQLLAKITLSNLLYAKSVKNCNSQILNAFKSYRNNLNKLLRNASALYSSKDFSSSGRRSDLMRK